MTQHSTALNVKAIKLSEHAFQRARERFNISDKNHALQHFRNILRFAKKVGNVTSEDGNECVLYAHERTGVYLSLDLTTIVTVNRHEHVKYQPLKNKIELLHRKEFNKLDRLEKSKLKKLEDLKLRSAIEIAQLEYRRKKTRSENVRKYCEDRINEIKNIIRDHEKEIENIRSSKRSVSKSMVSVL